MIIDFEDLCIFICLSVVTVISLSAIFGTAILFAGFILNATILAPYVTVTNGVAWFAIGWVSIVSYGLLYASHEQHKREQEEQEVRNVRKRCSHIDSTGARCRIPCAVPEFHNGEVRCSSHEIRFYM